MNETHQLVALLCCPCCGGQLQAEPPDARTTDGVRLVASCGRVFPVIDGVPYLVHPPGQPYLVEDAETYDRGIAFVTDVLKVSEQRIRRSLVEQLGLGSGGSVLEVACGPGPNLPYLLDAVGDGGHVYALDISPEMVLAARQRIRHDARATFVVANGCHLPLPDASVDALLHVGTLNRFDDIPRALAEMARVVRVGGIVIAADEGIGPWLEGTEYGRLLARFGTLFQGSPPLRDVPPRARDVSVSWLDGDAFFAIRFRVGTGERQLNLDVPLPGRSETVRAVLAGRVPPAGGER